MEFFQGLMEAKELINVSLYNFFGNNFFRYFQFDMLMFLFETIFADIVIIGFKHCKSPQIIDKIIIINTILPEHRIMRY